MICESDLVHHIVSRRDIDASLFSRTIFSLKRWWGGGGRMEKEWEGGRAGGKGGEGERKGVGG